MTALSQTYSSFRKTYTVISLQIKRSTTFIPINIFSLICDGCGFSILWAKNFYQIEFEKPFAFFFLTETLVLYQPCIGTKLWSLVTFIWCSTNLSDTFGGSSSIGGCSRQLVFNWQKVVNPSRYKISHWWGHPVWWGGYDTRHTTRIRPPLTVVLYNDNNSPIALT